MDSGFCVRALGNAMELTGRKLKIFNTDQGSQFTGQDWIGELKKNDISISMKGKGRWIGKVFIERLLRSAKYEHIYLFEHPTITELCAGLEERFESYNYWRPHQSHAGETPATTYASEEPRRIVTGADQTSLKKIA